MALDPILEEGFKLLDEMIDPQIKYIKKLYMELQKEFPDYLTDQFVVEAWKGLVGSHA